MKCVTDLGKSKLVESEKSCINGCANMYLQTNRRFMQQFMVHTPDMMKRKAEEKEKYAAAAEAAAAAQSPTIADAVTTDINPADIDIASISAPAAAIPTEIATPEIAAKPEVSTLEHATNPKKSPVPAQ